MQQHRTQVGILGIGAYLPPEVRKNDWWPDSVVSTWTERRDLGRAKHKDDLAPLTEGMRRVAQVMETLRDDPFQGAKERRVMPEGMKPSDMELRAAKDALAKSSIDPGKIGLLLCQSVVPDYLVSNNGCLLHHHLGLARECLTIGTEAACNAFVSQLGLAEQMIAGGRTRYALLVQSSALTRLVDRADPVSPNFGDGATAVVLGPVAAARGILSTQFRTDGRLHRGIVAGVPGGAWYDDGRVVVYSADLSAARRTFMEIADMGQEVVERALADAAIGPGDVDFFGVHQGTSWSRRLLQDHFGFERARSVETFAWTASLAAANIPLALSIAEKEGMLQDDEIVAMFAGGAGLSYSSAVLRWGR